jgi:outer membrane biosynthesis protein TonB
MMKRTARVVLTVSALSLGLLLGACDNFDPTAIFDAEMFNTKKKLPGERKEVFPNGVPGVPQGVPPELVKGNQQPTDQSAEQSGLPPEPPKPEAEAKPKPKPKPKVAAKPRPPQQSTAAAAPAQSQSGAQASSQAPWPNPPPQQQQQPAAAPWPNSPKPAGGGVAWPDPPAPR